MMLFWVCAGELVMITQEVIKTHTEINFWRFQYFGSSFTVFISTSCTLWFQPEPDMLTQLLNGLSLS